MTSDRRMSSRLFLAFTLTAFLAAPAFAEDDARKPMGPGGPDGRSKPAASKASSSSIHLARTTPLSAAVRAHDKVLEGCKLQTMLPQLIAERSSDVVLDDRAGGTRLELIITDVHAPSGGVFSGPKWITVEGKLVSGKTVKGDFLVKETSMASATACGMLTKVMTVIADDIAAWLRSPSKGARLGR